MISPIEIIQGCYDSRMLYQPFWIHCCYLPDAPTTLDKLARDTGNGWSVTQKKLYHLRDLGFLKIQRLARGIIVTALLPADCCPLPALSASAQPPPVASAPTPPAPPPISVASLVANAQATLPLSPTPNSNLQSPTPPPAPPSFTPAGDPPDLVEAVAAMISEFDAWPVTREKFSKQDLRTIAISYRKHLDLLEQANKFASWLASANPNGASKKAKSAAKKLDEIKRGKRTWYQAFSDHLDYPQGFRQGNRSTASSAPRPPAEPESDLPRFTQDAMRLHWQSLPRVDRDRYLQAADEFRNQLFSPNSPGWNCFNAEDHAMRHAMRDKERQS